MADKSAFVALPTAPPPGYTPPSDDFFTPRPTGTTAAPTPAAVEPTPVFNPAPQQARPVAPQQQSSAYESSPAYRAPQQQQQQQGNQGRVNPNNCGSSYGNIGGGGQRETSLSTAGGQPKRRWSFLGRKKN